MLPMTAWGLGPGRTVAAAVSGVLAAWATAIGWTLWRDGPGRIGGGALLVLVYLLGLAAVIAALTSMCGR